MSDVLRLYIGSGELFWDDVELDFISLLFDIDDYEVHETHSDLRNYFISTRAKVVQQLSKHGIDLRHIRNVYFSFFPFNYEAYRESLIETCDTYVQLRYGEEYPTDKLERMARFFLRSFKALNPDEEFERALEFHKCVGNFYRFESPKSTATPTPTHKPDSSNKGVDWSVEARDILKGFLSADPYTSHFEEADRATSGALDLDLLYKIGLSLFSSADDISVVADLTLTSLNSDPLDTKPIKSFLELSRARIKGRAALAFSTFNNIYLEAVGQAKSIFHAKGASVGRKEKGAQLERLMVDILSEEKGFVIKQNVKHPGEEVDLLVLNNVDSSFWKGIRSPVILVECKNKLSKAAPLDIRNFEGKMADRGPLCRFGLFVSTSGFTKNCYEVTRRTKRVGHVILLIDGEMLQRQLQQKMPTIQWLEEIISSQI